MVWTIFSSPSNRLSLEDAVNLANKQLENARKENNSSKAIQACKNAKGLLKGAEKIFAASRVGDPARDDSIANAYYEHGRLLDELKCHAKARQSHLKAEKWGYVHVVTQHIAPIPMDKISNSFRWPLCPPSTVLIAIPSVTAAIYQGVSNSNIASSVNQSPRDPRDPQNIFGNKTSRPVAKYTLPNAGGRIVSTPQLAYCLSLLNSSLTSVEGLNKTERDWLQDEASNPDEQKRLRTMATDVIRSFVRDELKNRDVVAEVACLAAVLDQDDLRKLFEIMVDRLEQSWLLKVCFLDGLTQLIRNAAQDFLGADDLVIILELLNMRLKGTSQQSTQNSYQLAQTVSRVLDSMVDCQVKGLNRELLHEPLSDYLENLRDSSDPYLAYQAAYAYQALLYIPDDETILQAMLRRTGRVVQEVSGVVSAVKNLDLISFIKVLRSIQGGLAAARKTPEFTENAYPGAKKPVTNEKGILKSLKENSNFTYKSVWYPALRGLDALLQAGRLVDFEKLVREAPCRHDPAFQWGVCQRLGELAANIVWDLDSRKYAVTFLGELYKDDATWGEEADIKHWILRIICQLTDPSIGDVADKAQDLLQELETDGDANKQAIYQSRGLNLFGFYPMMIGLLPQECSLLDRVQDKPEVETSLRQLRRERLEDRGEDVYISPRAKPNLKATEDFDLTSKVQEFLDSDKKVFLLLGDSGAGKSTFNRALEISLWGNYSRGGRIPLFIYLPTIDKPEHDLIAKQLRKANFTEKQIRELKMHRDFIVICDGYDESQQTRNLYTSNQWNGSGGWNGQMVISCRTEYAGVDYKDCFQPAGKNSCRLDELYQEAIIAPFNNNQIQDYINQFISLRKPPWDSMDYHRALKQIPNLQDLVKNPFLLKLALTVLPQIVDKKSEFTTARITRVGLYDEFVAQWIGRNKKRLTEMELSSRDKEALNILYSRGFKQQGIAYLKDLATAIYDNQGGNSVVNYSDIRDRGTWKEPFFGKRDGRHLLLEAIPFIRNGNQYRFIHKSVLEYGLTLAIFDPSTLEDNTEPVSTASTSRRGSTTSVLSFEIPVLAQETVSPIEQTLLDSPLGRRNFVRERSILQFLVERAQQVYIFKDQLFAAIERSKTDKPARTTATNAITILVRAGISFNGADLRGIRVPGADLSYGVFDSAQLEGADLRKANLRNIWLRQANLRKARMTEVQFGELPFLEENTQVACCAYSPDGRNYAVGTMSGEVSLYSTSDWRRMQTLRGHSQSVTCLAFSPVVDQIVTGSGDGTVRLWDVITGSCVYTFDGHCDLVVRVAFSPKGDEVASGGIDNTVRMWDVETGECLCTLQGHSDDVSTLEYSPNGDQIVSGSRDNTVRLWDVASGECLYILPDHGDVVLSAVFSPQGNLIASGSWDKTVRLWNVGTGNCVHILRGHRDAVETVAYSPKGSQIASGSNDNTVRLWDVDTGGCIHILHGHTSSITSVVYSPNGQRLASGSFDKSARLWDVETGDCMHTLSHSNIVTSVVYSPSGHQVASRSCEERARLWDVETGDTNHPFRSHTSTVTSVKYSPRGDQIASGSNDNTVRLWDFSTGECIWTLQGHDSGVASIAYSSSGDRLASGSWDKSVRLWNVHTGNCTHTLQGHTEGVISVAFSPKGDRIVSRSRDEAVRLWDVDTGDCVHDFKAPIMEGYNSWTVNVAYSPNGRQIASGGKGWTVQLYDVDTGDCTHTLHGHSHDILNILYSPKGDRIASAGRDNRVLLWDADTGNCIHKLKGHTRTVTCISFSPKGNRVASAGHDYTVRIWDVDTGKCDFTLRGHKDEISCVAFSPKDGHVASGGKDHTIRLWSTETGLCLTTISGFSGEVNSIAWDVHNGEYFVTCSLDKSVRLWQTTKEREEYKALLCWSSSHEALAVSDATFEDVQGLNRVSWMLLRQRGAFIASSSPHPDQEHESFHLGNIY